MSSTCAECDACEAVGSVCECINLCCPHRHFYGEIRYIVYDSHDLASTSEGIIHIYVRPVKDRPVAQPDFTVVAVEGQPLTITLPSHDDDQTCSDVNVTIPGYNVTIPPVNATANETVVVVPPDWEWGVECKPETLSAVILDAPLVAATEGTLSSAPGDVAARAGEAARILYRVDSPAINYLSYPAMWFGNHTPANQTLAEAQAEGRAMYLNQTMTVVYTPPPLAAGFPFFTLRYGLKDSTGDYSNSTTSVRIIVRHQLDDALSRFVRLPKWAFRPIDRPLNESVDWWANGAEGVDPNTLPPDQSAVNWLTPKLHGQMGAFSMVFGRNDVGQLGIGSAQVRRLPGLSDAPGIADLELSSVSAGDASVLAVSGAPGSVGDVYAWGDGSNGRLGLGDVYPRMSPTRVPGLSGAVRVAAGAGHAAAVTATGEIFTWGRDGDGQLGRSRRRGQLRGPVAFGAGVGGGDPAALAADEPMRPHRVVSGGIDRQDVVGVAVGEAHTVGRSRLGCISVDQWLERRPISSC